MSNYFEQITKRLNHHYSIQDLKKKRQQLRKELKAIEKKLEQLEENLLKEKATVEEQAISVDLPIEIFHEVTASQSQIDFLMDSGDEDDYLSSLCEAYQEELVAVETEIIALKSNPLSVAA